MKTPKGKIRGSSVFMWGLKGKERKGKERKGKESEVAQSCPTLCDLMDCSLPCSFVPGVLQARILEWVAISFSNA